MQNNESDNLQTLLNRFDREQRDFENHPLWRELDTTPQEFFTKVRSAVENSGIDPRLWQAKLAEARQSIQTRIKETQRDYHPPHFKPIIGLRA